VRGREGTERARLQTAVRPDQGAVEVGRDDVGVAREALGQLDQGGAV
jgi:hypothetical protein